MSRRKDFGSGEQNAGDRAIDRITALSAHVECSSLEIAVSAVGWQRPSLRTPLRRRVQSAGIGQKQS